MRKDQLLQCRVAANMMRDRPIPCEFAMPPHHHPIRSIAGHRAVLRGDLEDDGRIQTDLKGTGPKYAKAPSPP
ncbi:hypothetical protein [Azospirillum largimobile]